MKKNKFSKFATLTMSYNDEQLIAGMLEGVKELDNFVIISKPWYGEHKYFDKTEEIAKKMGATVIRKDFEKQHEQRNWGLSFLQEKGYKYIFALDTDEYYLKEDIPKIIDFIEKNPAEVYQSSTKDKIFWKNEHWYFIHGGFEVIIRSDIRYKRVRSTYSSNIKTLPDEFSMYHFAYSRTNEEMKKKITHQELSIRVRKDWFDEVWLKWTPEMENLHPVTPSVFKKALYLERLPNEIKNRYYL